MNVRHFIFLAASSGAIFACTSNAGSGASDGTTDNASSDLAVLCGKDECGPALGMPAKVCPDGSIGGNTGRCIKSAKSLACHWEIRGCDPDPKPEPCDCGPEPMTPVLKCWDGSTSGPICVDGDPDPTGGCAGGGGGVATGKPPASGSSPSPAPPVPVKKCGWHIRPCPPPPPPPPPPVPDCTAPGACGPALGMPNYLCPDGKTVAGPGPCIDQGGKCGWEIISCPK